MSVGRGYLLPDGDAYTDDIVCQLVYLPNKDEYWRALLGALDYFGTWQAWEKDQAKRGKDAARAWKEATEATMECWRMTTCLEDLQNDVSDILSLLENKKDCCDGNITYNIGPIVTTTIIPGVGPDPTEYGETAVADWDEWKEHLCYQAHRYVDSLILQANNLEAGLTVGGIALGVVGAALAAISLLATGGVTFPIVATVLAGLTAGGAGSMFDQAATDIEAARDDIVCALLTGGDLAGTIEAALTIPNSWTLFFAHGDYDSATAILYEGQGADGVYLTTEKLDTCSCDYEQLLDGDVTIHVVNTFGTNLVWDPVNLWWTVDSQTHTCAQLWMQIFTDPSKTVRKDVRWEVLACTGSVNLCLGGNHHTYSQLGTPPFTIVNHPDFVEPEDGVFNEVYEQHDAPFTVTFRLYEPA